MFADNRAGAVDRLLIPDGIVQCLFSLQVVWHSSSRVGCGLSNCTGAHDDRADQGINISPTIGWLQNGRWYCNFAVGMTSTSVPYEKGDSCAKCPDHCSNNLCGKCICLYSSPPLLLHREMRVPMASALNLLNMYGIKTILHLNHVPLPHTTCSI